MHFIECRTMCDEPKKRKRGPYKRYLKDPDIPVPKTSKWRKSLQPRKRPEASNGEGRSQVDYCTESIELVDPIKPIVSATLN